MSDELTTKEKVKKFLQSKNFPVLNPLEWHDAILKFLGENNTNSNNNADNNSAFDEKTVIILQEDLVRNITNGVIEDHWLTSYPENKNNHPEYKNLISSNIKNPENGGSLDKTVSDSSNASDTNDSSATSPSRHHSDELTPTKKNNDENDEASTNNTNSTTTANTSSNSNSNAPSPSVASPTSTSSLINSSSRQRRHIDLDGDEQQQQQQNHGWKLKQEQIKEAQKRRADFLSRRNDAVRPYRIQYSQAVHKLVDTIFKKVSQEIQIENFCSSDDDAVMYWAYLPYEYGQDEDLILDTWFVLQECITAGPGIVAKEQLALDYAAHHIRDCFHGALYQSVGDSWVQIHTKVTQALAPSIDQMLKVGEKPHPYAEELDWILYRGIPKDSVVDATSSSPPQENNNNSNDEKAKKYEVSEDTDNKPSAASASSTSTADVASSENKVVEGIKRIDSVSGGDGGMMTPREEEKQEEEMKEQSKKNDTTNATNNNNNNNANLSRRSSGTLSRKASNYKINMDGTPPAPLTIDDAVKLAIACTRCAPGPIDKSHVTEYKTLPINSQKQTEPADCYEVKYHGFRYPLVIFKDPSLGFGFRWSTLIEDWCVIA